MIVSFTRSDKCDVLYVGTNHQSCQLCPPARFRAAGHDVTGRRSHGVARWRGGKKEVTMTCFAHVLYTHKLAIGSSQKFGIIFYHQFAYRGGNFVEKHSLLYFWQFFPWCNVSRALSQPDWFRALLYLNRYSAFCKVKITS